MVKCRVCVLFGGVSSEHAVSLRSAQRVLQQMDPGKYTVYPVGITREGKWLLYGGKDYSLLPQEQWVKHQENTPVVLSPERGTGLVLQDGRVLAVDVLFPVLHGQNGEDGAIQGLAQLAGIACVGCGLMASAASMDKTVTKILAQHAGLRQAAWQVVTDAKSECLLPFPVFVKPAAAGSSVGVSRVENPAQLENALQKALAYGPKAILEEAITGKEIEVAVLGNRDVMISKCAQICPQADFYDYEAKYFAQTTQTQIPAQLSPEVTEQVRKAALTAYRALGCRGLSRVDFFVTPEETVLFNEINTMPGFASISMYPKLFAVAGLPCSMLLDRLIVLALEAYDETKGYAVDPGQPKVS